MLLPSHPQAVGFSFHNRKREAGHVKALRKPTDQVFNDEAFNDEEMVGHGGSPMGMSNLSESPGAVSSPEDLGQEEGRGGADGSRFIPLHEIVAMQWYYVDKNKQQQGPMSVQALTSHWKDQLVHENSYVWTTGMGEWVKLQKMPDLLLVLTHA